MPKARSTTTCKAAWPPPAKNWQRGIPNAESVPIPAEAFATESERRVRLGLLVSELVKQAQLQAKNRSAPASKSSPRTTNNPLRLSAITG